MPSTSDRPFFCRECRTYFCLHNRMPVTSPANVIDLAKYRERRNHEREQEPRGDR